MAELERYRDVFTACFGKAFPLAAPPFVSSLRTDTAKNNQELAGTPVVRSPFSNAFSRSCGGIGRLIRKPWARLQL